MKKITMSFLVCAFAFIAFAFTTIKEERKEVNTSESSVAWKGYKVTGSHEGTINLKSGYLLINKGTLTGGAFVVDMPTIIVTDIEAGDGKEKLEGHLASDDFFGVATYPTATLVFKSVKAFNKDSYTVMGDLTIKETTKPVTLVVSLADNNATATMKIDRTKFDVRYGSGSFFDNLGDKAIYDEFDLVVNLVL